MGIGKTRCAIDAVLQSADISHVLILCPSSVVRVWPKEFSKYDQEVQVQVIALDRGTVAKRMLAAKTVIDRSSAHARRSKIVVVINYEASWREPFAQWALHERWDLVVFDELHRAKSPTGKASEFCSRLRTVTDRAVGLSGTPIPNGPPDIWAQYRALDPSIFGSSFSRFKRQYEASYFYLPTGRVTPRREVIERITKDDPRVLAALKSSGRWPRDLAVGEAVWRAGFSMQDVVEVILSCPSTGARGYNYLMPMVQKISERFPRGANGGRWKSLDELAQKMDRIMMRVDRSVLTLPDATECDRFFDLDDDERRVYSDLQSSMVADVDQGRITVSNALSRLLRLQQVTCGHCAVEVEEGEEKEVRALGSSREQALKEALEDLRDQDGMIPPVAVFCRFRWDLDAIKRVATELTGVPALEVSGRVKELAAWQDGGSPVLAVQIQSGGVGIDLTRAHYAIYYSIGFSLSDLDQAKARTHRPGQTHPVTHIYLIATSTIDDRIRECIDSKRDIVESIMEGMKK
jgi:SNF2 family DNA or RNA helicase